MKQIPLTNSDLVALVDDPDYEWLSQFTWRPRNGLPLQQYARNAVGVDETDDELFIAYAAYYRATEPAP